MKHTSSWYRHSGPPSALTALFCLLAAPPASLRAQAPAPVNANSAAAAAMRESPNQQRAAVQKQLGQTATNGFFVSPRAAGLGPITGMAPAPSPEPVDCGPLPPSEVDSLVGQASQREGLDEDLLRGIMKQESAFRPCALSPKGAMGLMQLMPATAEQLGIQNPFDAASNVDAGAKFLKQLLNRYGGDIPRALGAYNAGPTRVDAAGGVPAIPETVDYIRQIMSSLPFIER